MNDDTTPDDAQPGTPPEGPPEEPARSEDAGLSAEEQRARDALRALPAPALSDLERRRLVRRAMEATEPTVPKSNSSTAARRWLAVGAAAAALFAVVVSISWLSGRSGDADMASGDGASTEASADATAESDEMPNADAAARSVEVVDLGALGSFDDDEEVLAAFDSVGGATIASGATQSYDADAADPCFGALPGDFLPLVVGTLTLDGTAAVIVGGETTDGAAVVYLLTAAECTPFDGWDPRPL